MKVSQTKVHLLSVCFCLLFSDGALAYYVYDQLSLTDAGAVGGVCPINIVVVCRWEQVNAVQKQDIYCYNSHTTSGCGSDNFNGGIFDGYYPKVGGIITSTPYVSNNKLCLNGECRNVYWQNGYWQWATSQPPADADGDGRPDSADNCPSVSNFNQLNTDGDTQGDACDADDDNDGVLDINDKFPLDATESIDTDNDSIGNNTDWDDDGDGVPDTVDVAPLDNSNTNEITLPLSAIYKGSTLHNSYTAQ